MASSILSLILLLQLMCSGAVDQPLQAPASPPLSCSIQEELHTARLWWGLIDPELSAWFARLPFSEADEGETILWDWSWRGFLASLFNTHLTKEDATYAPSV